MTDEQNEQTNEYQTYIDEIQNLRETTVSKDQYEKKCEGNRRLIQSLANGTPLPGAEQEPPKPSIDELRKKLANGDQLSNLEYVKTVLALRNSLIEKGEQDPFVPQGANVKPEATDWATAQRVADAFQSCVDYADGDSEIFTTELMRITKDSAPIYGKRR